MLLKSQYNHINHLDDKLNKIVEYIKRLEFDKLEQEDKNDFEKLKTDIEATIQKALNKNIMLIITIIGVFLTLSKLMDKF